MTQTTIIDLPPPQRKNITMPDANDASPDSNSPANSDDDVDSTVQSVTDLFDQMDRAAFRRMLASRDARRDAFSQTKTAKR